MPFRDPSGIGERIPRELIDGDFSIAFSLIQMSQAERDGSNPQLASELIGRAEQMLHNVRERLQRMTAAQKEAFEPRCAELAQAIARVKAQ